MTLIDHPEYLAKLNLWQNQTDLVKIVTGVRRCGKSKLLENYGTLLDFIAGKMA